MPSTTRTARTRPTGTVASLRSTTPRRIRSRSPSRVTVKPPNATTAPERRQQPGEQHDADHGEHDHHRRVRERAHRLLALALVEELLDDLARARQHRHDDAELPRGQRRDREIAPGEPPRRARRLVLGRLDGASACGRAARSSSTASGVSAGSEISPPFLPAPVWMSTA